MALASRRIQVLVEGNSASLQSAIDKAVASLKTLGDVATKQSQAAVEWNQRVIASNDQLMASYTRMAQAVKGSAGTITEAVKVERDAQVSLAGATDKATKSVVAAATKQAGAYRDAGTVIDRSARVQRDAIASVATVANRSAGDVAAASERSAAAQRAAADTSVASSRRSADGHAATAATASKSFASSGSALVRFGKVATEATAAVGLGSLYMAGKFEASSTRLLTQAGASAKEVKILQQGMLDLAGSLGQTPQHLSEGLYHVVSSMEAILPPAHRTQDELKIMAVAAQEAAIGNTNMEETSYALASAMNALHAPASQAKNVMAEMNAIVGSGDMTMQDLLDALRSGLIPTARTFGVSFRSVGAALAVMGDLGMRGALAGTRLRMSLALLAAPSDKAAKMLTAIGMGAGEVHARTTAMSEALEKAGLTTTTMAEDLKKPNGIAVAFRDLQDHLRKAGLSSTDAAALMSRAFGGGRMGATIQLLEQQVGRLEAKYKQTGELTRKWGEDVAKTHETLAFQAKQAGAAVEALGIKLGRDLTPYAKTALHDLEELAKFFEHNDKAAKALAITLGGVLGLAMAAFVANRIAKMVEGLKQVGSMLTWVRNGFSSTALTSGAATAGGGVVSTAHAETPLTTFAPGRIFGARGPEAPGSLTNPIVVAVESGTFAGLGSRAAAIGASPASAAENAALGTEARAGSVPALPAEARTPGGLIIPGSAASSDLAAASGVTPAVVAEQRAAITTAERSASSGALNSIRAGVGGVMANAMKGGMIGLGGIFASELVGAAVGGKTGHEISGVLKDASIGGAIGYAAAGPMGAAVGAAGAALIAGIKAIAGPSQASRTATRLTHTPGTYALPAEVEQAVNREKTKEEKELERLKNKTKGTRILPAGHGGEAVEHLPGRTPAEEKRATSVTDYYQNQIAGIVGKGMEEKRLHGGRNPGLEEIIREAKAHLESLRPVGRDAFMGFVRTMAQTLEHEGRLLPGSLKKMIDQLQPLLKGALPNAAGDSAKQFHDVFLANLHTQDMVSHLSKTATDIGKEWGHSFGLLPVYTDMSFAEITQHTNHDMGVLQHIMKTGTQQQREEAEGEYKLLVPGLKNYMAAAKREVEAELKALSHQTGPEAEKATTAIVKKWEELPHGLKLQLEHANKEVKDGLKKMDQETERDLKALSGQTNVTVEQVGNHPHGGGQLHGAQGMMLQLGRSGQAGRDSIPLNVGGTDIVAAPGEIVTVFTRHQAAEANRRMADIGGLPGLFNKVSTPNYMASGGFVPSEAYPGPRGRIDQGVDYAGPGPVRAVLDGMVKSVGLWPGWPGTGGIVYNTAKGVVYVMENFAAAAGMRSGQHLQAGQLIGEDTGGAYGIETGWANASGTAPIIQYGTAPDGTPMPGGKSFASFLGGGPGGGTGGVAANIVAPKVKAAGLIGRYAQNLLSKYATIANAIVSAGGGSATGGPSFGAPDTSALPAAARARLGQIASERHWSVNDWLAVIGLESGGNPAARNPSGAYGIGQALGATQREFPKMVSSNPSVQVEGMGEYIASRYGTPSAALAHEHAFHWYDQGGIVEHASSGLPSKTVIKTGAGATKASKTTPPKYHHATTHKPHLSARGKGKNLAGLLRNLAGIPDLEKLPEMLAPEEKILGELGNLTGLVKTVEADPKGPVIIPSDLQYIPGLAQHGVHANMPTTEAYRTYEQLLGSQGESPQLHLEGEIVKWAEGQADHRLLTPQQASIIAPAGKGLHWAPKAGYAVLQVEEQIEVLEQNHLEAEERRVGGILFTLQRAVAERNAREKRLKHLKAVTEHRESHIKTDLRRLSATSLKEKLAAATDSAAQSERVQDALEHKAAVHELVTDISSIPSAQRTRAQNRELPGLKQEESGINDYLVKIRNPIRSHEASKQRAELAILKNHLQGELVPLQARLKKVDSSELGVGIKGVQSEIKTILRDEPGAEEKLAEITGVKLPTVELNLEEIARSMQEAELPKIVPATGGENAKDAELLSIQKQLNAQLAMQNIVVEAQVATLKNFMLNVPRYDKGGPVLEDGLAYIHRGEHVIPREGALVQTPGSSPIHVNVQNNVHGDIAPLIALIDSRVAHPSNVAAISQHMQRRVYNLPGYRH